MFLCFPLTCFAQFNITGRVIDKRYKTPILNAKVFLTDDTARYKTNDDGAFTIPNVKPGEYTLVITSADYETYANSWHVYDNNVSLPDINLLGVDELDVVNNKYNKVAIATLLFLRKYF